MTPTPIEALMTAVGQLVTAAIWVAKEPIQEIAAVTS